MTLNDIIAAVSTPRGKGGVALIRISGSGALELAARIFVPAGKRGLLDTEPRRAVYGAVFEGEERDCLPVDDGILTYFKAPNSFTGEDVVEICCHGGLLSTEAVLSAVLSAGARHAEAGEFTRRAFINGRIGLAEAEALSNLLEAKNYSQLRLANAGKQGKLGKKCGEIYSSLASVLAALFAKIDYPDEDLAEVGRDEMSERVRSAIKEISALRATYKSGHAVAEGVSTVICGRPNVGKSSLYNRIVGREAAIVTDLEGTTRDLLEETASFGGVTLRICDTAGLRSSDDKVEMIGVERAYEKLDDAELIIALFDGSSRLTAEDEEMISYLSDKKDRVLAVVNKCELDSNIERSRLEDEFSEIVSITAAGEGDLSPLEEAVKARFIDGRLDLDRDAVVFGARQFAALVKSEERLREALALVESGFEIDAAAFAVEDAMGALAELDGRAVGEDVVSLIFSRFCVGK